MRANSPKRAGFTLVELLVVISIIGTLLALLLPAVQAARSAARRSTCLSNLHQIGIALTGYHSANRKFPVGCIEPISPAFPKGRQLAWSALLLPYMEEKSLHERIDFTKPFDSPENAEAAAEVVATYVCPSVPRTSYLIDGRGVCDYGGMYGEHIESSNSPPNGTMLYNRSVSIRQILDGASKTLIVAEDGGWEDGQWINGLNIFDQKYAINYTPSPQQPLENEIRSPHPGGAHALLADGSARFLNEEMELEALAAICTREGDEIVDEF